MLAEKETRLQFSAIYESVVAWLNSAETVVEEDYDGVDYEVVGQKLTLHKVRFRLYLKVTFAHVYYI